jgi:hypothetical protein
MTGTQGSVHWVLGRLKSDGFVRLSTWHRARHAGVGAAATRRLSLLAPALAPALQAQPAAAAPAPTEEELALSNADQQQPADQQHASNLAAGALAGLSGFAASLTRALGQIESDNKRAQTEAEAAAEKLAAERLEAAFRQRLADATREVWACLAPLFEVPPGWLPRLPCRRLLALRQAARAPHGAALLALLTFCVVASAFLLLPPHDDPQGSSESAYNALEALSKEAVAALAKERYLRQAAFARMTDLQNRLDQVRAIATRACVYVGMRGSLPLLLHV